MKSKGQLERAGQTGACLHGGEGEVDGVKGEVALVLHVIYIAPHGVQGDARSRVIVHNLLHLPNARVPIPAPTIGPQLLSLKALRATQAKPQSSLMCVISGGCMRCT